MIKYVYIHNPYYILKGGSVIKGMFCNFLYIEIEKKQGLVSLFGTIPEKTMKNNKPYNTLMLLVLTDKLLVDLGPLSYWCTAMHAPNIVSETGVLISFLTEGPGSVIVGFKIVTGVLKCLKGFQNRISVLNYLIVIRSGKGFLFLFI